MSQGWRLTLVLALTALLGVAASPRLSSVEPDSGKPGDELVVKGENLDKTSVALLFLTDGQNDHKVDMVEQTAEAIRFRIPNKIEPGQYRLMVQTTDPTPLLLEQPVLCTVLGE